jgi:RecA/RadA recombinase
MKKTVAEIKADLRAPRAAVAGPVPVQDLLSTGSTLLNLGLTNKPNGGFAKGKYFWIAGDSSSGKTFFTLTQFAEAAQNKNFDDYDFIYDNGEDGALMNIVDFFGQRVADRLRAPRYKNGQPVVSHLVEEFYFNVDRMIKRAREPGGIKGIYVLDSENLLSTEQEGDKYEERLKAFKEGKDISGTMTDGKAKLHSSNLRRIIPELRETGCILIILSQTRDTIGFGAKFSPKSTSGGRALEFYATAQIWTSKLQKLQRSVRGKQRSIGRMVLVKIKKNRFTGKDRDIEIPIYWTYGFDDIGSCIDYLIEEKWWKPSTKVKGSFLCQDWKFRGTREEIIAYIEENNLEKELRNITADLWNEIEAACAVDRKKRYA